MGDTCIHQSEKVAVVGVVASLVLNTGEHEPVRILFQLQGQKVKLDDPFP